MLTRSLKGNILSLYVALALDLPENGTMCLAWDAWECDVIIEGREFGPFDTPQAVNEPYALLAILPTVLSWRLSSRPLGQDQWLVETPDGQSYWAPTLIHSYALAIVGSVFGEEVPDWYEDREFTKNVFLPPFNVPYGERGPNDKSPNSKTFTAPPAGSVSYSKALLQARTMIDNGQAFNHSCDGHSWVQVQLMDGSVHSLYSGVSTIGLPPSAPN